MDLKQALVLIALFMAVAIPADAAAEQGRPRQRIAFSGLIAHGATGIPQNQKFVGEPGDLLILRSNAKSGEKIEVGAYLFYRGIDGQDRPIGDWQGVPASAWGKDHNYYSRSWKSVCAAIQFDNPGKEEATFDFSLFLPYEAISLAQGRRYQFRYLIQARANGQLLDNFWIDAIQTGVIEPSGLLRLGCALCAAQSGPCLTQFYLAGTTDKLEPVPSVPTGALRDEKTEETPVFKE